MAHIAMNNLKMIDNDAFDDAEISNFVMGLANYDEVFDLYAGNTVVARFNVTEIIKCWVTASPTWAVVAFQFTPETIDNFRKNTNPFHCLGMKKSRLAAPGFIVDYDGLLMIDGRHRAVRLHDLGYEAMRCFMVPAPITQRFVKRIAR